MGLFGDDENQDARLDEIERQLRRVVEEVQQLSIDLGVTRMELLRARIDLSRTVAASDIDPLFVSLNETIASARDQAEQARASAEVNWVTLQTESAKALEELRDSLNKAWTDASAG